MKNVAFHAGILLFTLFILTPSMADPEPQCDRAYPDVCIPSPPPDLDCPDTKYKNFKVLPPDPHHFDRDKDGTGCES